MSEQTKTSDLENAIEQATEAVAIQAARFDTLSAGAPSGDPIGIESLMPVPVRVTVEVGRTRKTLADIVKLAPGSLLGLDREAHEPVDVLVNGQVVAHGEVVTIDNMYGVRITSVEGKS
jgi:flagellar motor switch protein FliN/FliY